MNRYVRTALAGGLGAALLASVAHAATLNVNSTVDVAAAVAVALDGAVSTDNTLDFGDIVNVASGTVVLATTGTAADTGVSSAGTRVVPVIDITSGASSAGLNVTVTVTDFVLNNGGASSLANDMEVNTFTFAATTGTQVSVTPGASDDVAVYTLDGSGEVQDLKIGATLNLDGNEVAGTYTGIMAVVVVYE